MAALRAADGAFLLGRMAKHTANAGKVYFPSGTPDPNDVRDGGIVDLDGSVRRELLEETGLISTDAKPGGWHAVLAGARVALIARWKRRRTPKRLPRAYGCTWRRRRDRNSPMS